MKLPTKHASNYNNNHDIHEYVKIKNSNGLG